MDLEREGMENLDKMLEFLSDENKLAAGDEAKLINSNKLINYNDNKIRCLNIPEGSRRGRGRRGN